MLASQHRLPSLGRGDYTGCPRMAEGGAVGGPATQEREKFHKMLCAVTSHGRGRQNIAPFLDSQYRERWGPS